MVAAAALPSVSAVVEKCVGRNLNRHTGSADLPIASNALESVPVRTEEGVGR
jgi:hypothetical protein